MNRRLNGRAVSKPVGVVGDGMLHFHSFCFVFQNSPQIHIRIDMEKVTFCYIRRSQVVFSLEDLVWKFNNSFDVKFWTILLHELNGTLGLNKWSCVFFKVMFAHIWICIVPMKRMLDFLFFLARIAFLCYINLCFIKWLRNYEGYG